MRTLLLMLALTLALPVTGCGDLGDMEVTAASDIARKVGGEGYDIRPGFAYEIAKWQEAERECLPYPVNRQSGEVTYDEIFDAADEASTILVNYVEDHTDIHTSCTVMATQTGDCTETAVIIYRLLREAGHGDGRLWIVGVRGTDHDVLLIETGGGILIADNGRYSGELLTYVQQWPEYDYAFNLFDIKTND